MNLYSTRLVGPPSLPSAGTAVVRKMRSPHTMGEEWPRPGTLAFHAICSSSLQCNGASPRAIPSSFGPRQWGQSASPARAADAQTTNANKRPLLCMRLIILWLPGDRAGGASRGSVSRFRRFGGSVEDALQSDLMDV